MSMASGLLQRLGQQQAPPLREIYVYGILSETGLGASSGGFASVLQLLGAIEALSDRFAFRWHKEWPSTLSAGNTQYLHLSHEADLEHMPWLCSSGTSEQVFLCMQSSVCNLL